MKSTRSRSTSSKRGAEPYKQSKLAFTQSKPGASLKSKKTKRVEPAPVATSSEESDIEEVPSVEPVRNSVNERMSLDDLEKAGRFKRHWTEVQDRMGNIKPIHINHETKTHKILRVFDLSYEYGPCIGVSRLERWERANALGLDPPSEVREILLSDQGIDKPEFAQNVFYSEEV